MKTAAQLIDALEHIDEEYNLHYEEGLMTPDSGYFWEKHEQEQDWISEAVLFLMQEAK